MICTLSFSHFTKNRDLKTDALLYKLRSIGVNNYYNFYFIFYFFGNIQYDAPKYNVEECTQG